MSLVYDQGKLELVDGTIDWVNDVIKAMLVTSGYTANATHLFVDSGSGGANPLTNEVSGTGYSRLTLASKSITLSGAQHRVQWLAATLTWLAVNGFTAAGAIIYADSGVDTTSRLLAYINTGGFPRTANGSDIAMIWGVAGVISVI